MIQLPKQVTLAKFQSFLKTSVFSILGATLSSDNLLTGYEQLSYQQFNQNLSICVSAKAQSRFGNL